MGAFHATIRESPEHNQIQRRQRHNRVSNPLQKPQAADQAIDASSGHADDKRVLPELSASELASCSTASMSAKDGEAGSCISHGSLSDMRRVSTCDAKQLFERVFNPVRGELECVVSQFISAAELENVGDFVATFLGDELRDRWSLDVVMLAALGRDQRHLRRAMAGGRANEVAALRPARFLQLQRDECANDLRQLLNELSGVATKAVAHRRQTLQSLLLDFKHHPLDSRPPVTLKSTPPRAGEATANSDEPPQTSREHRGSKASPDSNAKRTSSFYIARMEASAQASFECLDLIARRFPTSLSTLQQDYFLSAIPIIDPRMSASPSRVDELGHRSFFVTLDDRVRALTGATLDNDDEEERVAGGDEGEVSFIVSSVRRRNNNGAAMKPKLRSADELITAVTNLGLVFSTACSSLVYFVLFHLAESIQCRNRYRALRHEAAERGIAFEALLQGAGLGPPKRYLGKPGDSITDWLSYVSGEEMSLSVFTALLIKRYRTDNASKMENLRKRYFNIFAYLEAIGTSKDSDNLDVMHILGGAVLKLMLIVGGGQRSIEADDCRVPMHAGHTPDDVRLSHMLEVPVLNHICWSMTMMGLPVMDGASVAVSSREAKPFSFLESDECAGVLRELFQGVGALPLGSSCPSGFAQWLPLFPFYAVSSESKRMLLNLYMVQSTAVRTMALSVQKDVALPTFTDSLMQSRKLDRSDAMSYVIKPTFGVGYSQLKQRQVPSSSSPSPSPAPERSGGGNGTAVRDNRMAVRKTSAGSPVATLQHDSPLQYLYGTIDEMLSGSFNEPPSALCEASSTSSSATASNSRSGSSSVSSASTLMSEDAAVDIYTCAAPVTQLYLRIANELTAREHKTLELTPSVTTSFFRSVRELGKERPDVAAVVEPRIPHCYPSEAIVLLRWSGGEPLVTFQAGDYLSVMLERLPSTNATRHRSRYFTGATRRPSTSDHRQGRRPSVVIDAANPSEKELMPSRQPSSASSVDSFAPNEHTRAFQRVMHQMLGTEEHTQRRFGTRWAVIEVIPLQRADATTADGGAAISRRNSAASLTDPQVEEIALHVFSPEFTLTDPYKIITIGHERASTNAFSFIDESNTVCWTNPKLIVESKASSSCNASSSQPLSVIRSKSISADSQTARTGKENNEFFALGFLLAHSIINGTQLQVPIAPLAFYLFKRMVATADSTFRSFTWLEPSDGNLLSSPLVLKTAFEVFFMNEREYVHFLRTRGLTRPENLVFPVRYSLAMEEDSSRGSSPRSFSRSSASPVFSSTRDGRQGKRQPLRNRSYLEIIKRHNERGSMFSGPSLSDELDQNLTQHDSPSSPADVVMPVSAAERPRRGPSRDEKAASSRQGSNLTDHGLLHRLPSREEYITLYLVNDLTWSSVRRNGRGDRARELWASIAKGFKTSPLARSPLMTHCCSRIIREVLCVPDAERYSTKRK